VEKRFKGKHFLVDAADSSQILPALEISGKKICKQYCINFSWKRESAS